jgi:hypothetical protein
VGSVKASFCFAALLNALPTVQEQCRMPIERLLIAVLDRPLICERKYVQPLSITWWLILFVSVHNNDSMHGCIIHIFYILSVYIIYPDFEVTYLRAYMQRAREIKRAPLSWHDRCGEFCT